MPNSLAWVQIGFAQVNPQADNRAPKLTLPNSHPAACHHRLALQSNKVYPPPCTTACSTWAVLAVDKRYSLAGMNRRFAFIHVLICVLAGALVAALTDVHWLAASFWCSAALFITGSIAYIEDSIPGGFDNPEGTEESLGYWFLLKSIGIALVLALLGFASQTWFGAHAS